MNFTYGWRFHLSNEAGPIGCPCLIDWMVIFCGGDWQQRDDTEIGRREMAIIVTVCEKEALKNNKHAWSLNLFIGGAPLPQMDF